MIAIAVGLFIVGLGLVLAEVLLPSFGLFTLLSCGCFVGSSVIAFGQNTTIGVVFVSAAFVAVPITIMLAFRLLERSRLGNHILLGAPDTPQGVDAIYGDNTRLVGRQGTTVTALRPAGTVDFDGERVPVVTEGDHVVAGRPVEVVAVEGNRIVVRPTDPAPEEDEEED